MTIFFYILKDFLKYVTGIVILCVFLFILGDFIQRTTKYFAQYQPTTQEMMQMYLYQLPSQLIQILPIAALMGSVICMILMSRTNEITAMRAAGMGPLKVGLPILIGGAAISVLAFCLGEFVLPKSATRLHYVKEVLIEGSKEHGTTGESRWFRDRNRLFTFQEYDRINRILRSPKVIETGINNRPVTAIHADSAYYESALGVWEMRNVKRVHFTPSGTILNISKAPDQLIEIPVEPDKLQKDRRKPNELSLVELTDLVNRGRESGVSITGLNVERHLKFAFYFSSFVLVIMGLKFAFQSERTVESAKSVLIALLLGIMYWVIFTGGAAVGKQGTLPAWLAAWVANIVVAGMGVSEVIRAKQS